MEGFLSEIKQAAPNLRTLRDALAPSLSDMGALGGVGAAVGGAGLGGLGALHGYRRSRARGDSRTDALEAALRRGLSGARRGAVVGGTFGAALGASNPGIRQQLLQSGFLGAPARFGVRQVHGLTGMLRPTELEAVRGGAYDARRAFQAAVQDGFRGGGGVMSAKNLSRARSARDALRTAETVQKLELTSLPGFVKAVRDPDVGLRKAVGATLEHQWRSPGPAMALALAPPTAGLARAIGSKKERERGKGRGERAVGNLAELAGGLATGAMPIGAGQLVAGTMKRVGSVVGRGVDHLRVRRNGDSPR